jgi:hypothetical protein
MYPDPAPPVEISYGCLGDRAPHCNDMAVQLNVQGGGSILEGMAAGAGTSLAQTRDVFLGSFSAGGSVVSRMLYNKSDAKRVKAILLSDSTYSASWVDPSRRIPTVSQSVVEFGIQVARGPGNQLFIATASPSPNFNWATGVEVLAEIRRQIEIQGSVTFSKIDSFYGINPGPVAVYRTGTVLFAEYPMEPLGHGHPKIAPQVWQNALWPWVKQQRGEAPFGEVFSGDKALAAVIGLVAGYSVTEIIGN